MHKKKYSSNTKLRVFITTALGTIALACVLPFESVLARALVSAYVAITVMSIAVIWKDRHWEMETLIDWSGKAGEMVVMTWDYDKDVLQIYRRNETTAEYLPQVGKTLIHVDEVEGTVLRKKYAIMVDNVTIRRDEAIIRRMDSRTITIRQNELVIRVKRCKLVEEFFAA